MRWFKHMTTSGHDEKLIMVIEELGMEGYGIYWRLLEIVAAEVGRNLQVSLNFSSTIWAKRLYISPQKFKKSSNFLAKVCLINLTIVEKSYRIEIPNLLKYKDEYTKKSGVTPDKLRSHSGVTPESTRERARAQIRLQNTEESINLVSNHRLDVQDFILEYLKSCPSGKIISQDTHSDVLAKKITKALNAHPIEWWSDVFAKAEASDFLAGRVAAQDGEYFKINIGWVIRLDMAQRINDGRYDNHKKAGTRASGHDPGFRIDRDPNVAWENMPDADQAETELPEWATN